MADFSYEHAARVYRKQGATEFTVASGGRINVEPGGRIDLSSGGAGALILATGEIGASDLAGNLASGSIPLDLFSARALSSAEAFFNSSAGATGAGGQGKGGVLTGNSAPKLAYPASNSLSAYLEWASGNAAGIAFPPLFLPPDFTTALPVVVDLYGENASGATADAISAIQVKAFSGVGGADVGSTHPNFTSTPAAQSVQLATGSLSSGVLNLVLVPQAHANKALRLYGARVRYGRSS